MYELAVVVPVVMGVVEVIKQSGLSSRYSSLVSLILGCAVMYFVGEGEVVARLFDGVIAGLSASGLYSSVKTQIK